jgi:hypothetical protein
MRSMLISAGGGARCAAYRPVPKRGRQPNPLMQPTNAGDVGRRPPPSLPVGVWTIGFHRVVCS